MEEKSRARGKRPNRTIARNGARPEPAPSSPRKADIPPLNVAIPEEPDHLRKREEAFKRRRGVTR
jgi:hypothetical protein